MLPWCTPHMASPSGTQAALPEKGSVSQRVPAVHLTVAQLFTLGRLHGLCAAQLGSQRQSDALKLLGAALQSGQVQRPCRAAVGRFPRSDACVHLRCSLSCLPCCDVIPC